jgi:hypothetical protein
MPEHPFNRLSGIVPIMMSVVALLMVAKSAVNFRHYGLPSHEDGPWHVFMLMMFVQLPMICYFAIRSRRDLPKALPVLAAQLGLWAVSLGAAYCLPGL